MLHAQSADPADALWPEFLEPPAEARPMMRWWWFGPAVDTAEIDRELRAMKAGGIGGVEVQPVYPLQLDEAGKEPRNQPFLSPEFLSALRHAAQTARAEGLRIDVTGGSGWPFGGPHVDVDHASSEIRMVPIPLAPREERVILPAVGPGEQMLAASIGPAITERSADRPLQPLPIDGPHAAVPASNAPREVLVFIAGRTGQQVKRPALGAEGFVLDHLDPVAVATHWQRVVQPLLSAFNGMAPPHAVFSDSLEAYGASWTPDLPAEFARRRGYDILDHLPSLFLDTPDSQAVRYDWARTLTELVDERYLRTINAWAEANGTRFRAQVYGFPPTTLSSNALVALPEGEGQDWRSFTSTRWATSGAHLYGHPVVSSEVWTWLNSPSWAATPLDMKMEADRHFLQGVTQLVGHGWPYSPPTVPEPGWSFYAAAALNDHNPWYPVMPEVSLYLARVSHMLRQGTPSNQVAIYLPIEDAFAEMSPARASANEAMEHHLPEGLVGDVLDAGFGFDFIDAGAVRSRAFPHSVLLMPKMNRIDADAYARIERWLGDGGKLVAIGALPQMAGGLRDRDEAEAVRAISQRLAKNPAVAIIDAEQAAQALRAVTEPDMALAEANPAIGYVRRSTQGSDIYFVVNSGNRPVRTSARFASRFPAGQWWDPMNARRWPAAGRTVELELAPYESRFLVFQDQPHNAPPPAESPAERQSLAEGWTLQIDGKQISDDVFDAWARTGDLRFFSGTGTYSRSMRIASVEPEHCYLLDFGEAEAADAPPGSRHRAEVEPPIHAAAIVRVNGEEVGALWAPPYRLDITGALADGENAIEVAVSNTALNHLAGQPREDYRLLHRRYGERFQPQDQDRIAPQPSGILGEVNLLKVSASSAECGR